MVKLTNMVKLTRSSVTRAIIYRIISLFALVTGEAERGDSAPPKITTCTVSQGSDYRLKFAPSMESHLRHP